MGPLLPPKTSAADIARLRARLERRARQEGQTLVEYSLILAVIAIACIAAFGLLGNQVCVIFSAIETLLDTAQASH
jgi:Flp pilus assembly pilin Flp